MAYPVILTPQASRDLQRIQRYIAKAASPPIAQAYLSRMTTALEKLGEAPFQGTKREDLGSGIRTTGFERRASFLFQVRDERVFVISVFYAGRQRSSK